MNFKSFKKNQNKLKDSLNKLAQQPANSYADERFWNVTKDTTGNGSAIIRFLPQKDPDNSPILLTFRHAFQKEGRWFIEECPVTIGEKCPVCEYSSSIWNSNEKEARKHWRTKSYIANIIVVKDEANPDFEGNVFMFKFGKKIYDMIMNRVAPEDDDGDEGVNVFDFDEGLDFRLKLGQVSGYNNYDKSSFSFKSSAVADGKIKAQEEIYNKIYSLDEFIDPEKFKSYDDLLKKLTGSNAANKVPSLDAELKEDKKSEVVEDKKSEPFDPDKDIDEDDTDDIDFESLLDDDIPF